tara:strand:+ start:213 stop:320 length:108 start_codon:yes stop_codon:yes gene_type:complete
MDKIDIDDFWMSPEDEQYEMLIQKINEIVDWINSQ